MKTLLSGALLAAPVCAAVLALPVGEAMAQREACGALASGAATCSNQAYASGIQYDVSGGWVNGIVGNIALTVTGGAATTITSAATTGWGSGIVLRTAEQPGTGATTATRTVTLNAGTGTGSPDVDIVQSTATISGGFDDTGVVVHQRGRAADATTVNLGSGVTIGTATTAMERSGVHVLAESRSNTGLQKIDSAATIYSGAFGLMMDNRGSGNTEITNSGSITVESAGGVAGQKDGIRILDWGHGGGRAETSVGANDGLAASIGGSTRTTASTTTVTNSGAITVSADSAHGINVDAMGLGRHKIVHSGTGDDKITASGADGIGIRVDARWHRGDGDNDLVEIDSSGDITASGAGARGIHVLTIGDDAAPGTWHSDTGGTTYTQRFDSSGHIKVTTTGGTITTTAGADSIGIFVIHDVVTPAEGRATTAEITNAATISSTAYAIVMDARSSGDVTVVNSGALTVTGTNAVQAGIRVVDWLHNPAATPTPVIGGASRVAETMTKVTNSGDIEATTEGHGIWVDAFGLGRYEIVHGVAAEETVEGSIEVSGENSHGIYIDADYNAGATVSVMSSGAITASGANGIGIYVKNNVIDGHTVGDDDTPDADLGGDIEVTNSGRIEVKSHGILVSNKGNSGAVTVMHSGGAVVSERETGITAEIGGASSTNPGTVRVDVTGGSVTASATRSKVAVHARTWGTGSVVANVGEGATLNSRHNVGLFAVIEDNANNAVGRISVA